MHGEVVAALSEGASVDDALSLTDGLASHLTEPVDQQQRDRIAETALIERSALLNLAEQTAEIGVWDIDIDTRKVRGYT